MTSHIFNLNTERKQRINQTGKWEHEKLAKISFKVFRHLDDDSVITSCQLCSKHEDSKIDMNSENYFILSSTSNGNVFLTDVDSGETIKQLNHSFENPRIPEIHRAKYDKKSKILGYVCMDGTICEYDLKNDIKIFEEKLPGSCQDFDIDREKQMFSTVCDIDNSLHIFDTRQKLPVLKISNLHDATPTSCVFVGTTGQKIATAGMDGVLKVTDLASQRVLIKIQENGVISSATSDPFEKRTIITTSWNKTVKLYDIATGCYRHEIKNRNDESFEEDDNEVNSFAHTGCVSCSAFLNQKHLVTGAYDRHAILWSIGKNNRLCKSVDLRGHEDWVTGIDGSNDANWVLTSSKDATMRLWNLENAVMKVDKPQLV